MGHHGSLSVAGGRMKPGDMVYYLNERGAHFGRLRSIGRKWATVEGGWKVARVLVEDVKPWPPAKVDASAKPVKRGRV